MAVAGESAGGNLAVATAMQARDLGIRPPVHVLAVYPLADGDTESASYEEHAEAVPLSRPAMQWFFGHALRQPTDARDPRISLVDANLANLPPTTLILAEVDPLRSDGEELGDRLRDAGVTVTSEVWNGSTHEFFGLGAVVDDARDAVEYAADKLRSSFGNANE